MWRSLIWEQMRFHQSWKEVMTATNGNSFCETNGIFAQAQGITAALVSEKLSSVDGRVNLTTVHCTPGTCRINKFFSIA